MTDLDRVAQLKARLNLPVDYAPKFRGGSGSGAEGDCCVIQDSRRVRGLDAKSYVIPETDSDVIGRFLLSLNDASAVWRSKLGPYEFLLIDSRGTPAIEERRALRLADWTLREILPEAIDATVKLCDGDSEQTRELSRIAEELRAAKPIAARAARAALADRAALAALADLAALAARAARAAEEEKLWPRIAGLLDELLAMS